MLSATGLDSLSSIKIASQLRKVGYARISATDVLEARKLKDLVHHLTTSQAPAAETLPTTSLLDDASTRAAFEAHPQLRPCLEDVQDIFPCTAAQTAMLSETAKDPQAYCNWVELRIDAQYSLERVEAALNRLTATHDMLRAGFAELQDARNPYATVVWKPDSHGSRIRRVELLDKDFAINGSKSLLRPRVIQIRPGDEGTELVLQVHHALYDQWSIDVLKADLASLLEKNNIASNASFASVSAYYAQSRQTSPLDEDEDFWQHHLQEAVPTPMPQLNERRMEPCLRRSAWRSTEIITDSLRTKAKELGSSGHAIFQAAFAYLLSMYTGSHDVVYGSVFSGREIPVPGIEQVFGPCLATLPSRINTSDARTGHDLLRMCHDRSRTMLKHAGTPLADIKKIGRFALDTTMFDALFVWQESLIVAPDHVKEVDSADYHEFNLVLEVEPGQGHLSVRMTYQQDRISADVIDLMIDQLQVLVHQLVDHPDTPITELGRLLPSKLLSVANPHPAKHRYQQGLVACLEEACHRDPSKPALVFGESLALDDMKVRSLSYQDLHDQANRLAHALIAKSIKPNDLVCVCMEKSFELYVAILAVLKAGAGYLPLLPDTPVDRILSAVEQSNVKLCLGDDLSSSRLAPELSIEVINLHTHTLDTTQYSAHSPTLPYNGSHAAYAVFTSGSTGTPKGLIVTQDNLLGNLAHLSSVYPVDDGDRLLQACSQAFDVSVFEIFFAWFKGMSLCFAGKDELFQDIEHGIHALQATHLSLTPTVAALVDPIKVPAVKFLVTAGEAMTESVHKKWAGNKLFQGYGPSETTNICTVNPQMPASDIISNIGRPFANTSAFVIRSEGDFEILPLGSVGELVFGGEQVFRGYIARDELNAEKIIEHAEYGRVYRSGDIGRILPCGSILISGRLDDQVKIRGNRVELGEITACMLQADAVQDATTIVMGSDATNQSLVSFWVPRDADTLILGVLPPSGIMQTHVTSFFSRIESSLPSYMTPDAIIPVSALPRTAQGKLDKRQLEHIALSLDSQTKPHYFRSSEATSDEGEEWSDLERELLQMLTQTLGLASTGILRTTSFFALGLNSINTIAFAKAIASRLGKRIPVSFVLRHVNIARLARSLLTEALSSTAAPPPSVTLLSESTLTEARSRIHTDSRAISAVLPCTPLQEAMLSAGASQDVSAYCNVTTFTIRGDIATLRHCFERLVARHEILRTFFVETSDVQHPYVQIVLRNRQLPWEDDTNIKQDPIKRSQVNLTQPYSFVVRHAAGSTWLKLMMHHALYDGVSTALLLEEAEKIYHNQELSLPPSFEPFCAEVQRHGGPDAMAYWSRLLDGYVSKPFPRLPELSSSIEQCITKSLRVDQNAVDNFCKRHAVNAISLYQTAWAKVLARLQKAVDVCFGDVVSGRTVPVPEVERLVAPCFNTVPVRAELGSTRNNIDLAHQLHKQRLETDLRQLSPLRRIQSLSRTPEYALFSSLLLVQPPAQDLDRRIWERLSDEGSMDLPLVIEFVPDRQGVRLNVHHQTGYVRRELASSIADALDRSLSDCIAYPAGDVLLLSGDETCELESALASNVEVKDRGQSDSAPGVKSEGLWDNDELLIRQTFSDISRAPEFKVRRDTSLFRLGLDSLNAVQIASRLRKAGLDVSAADVMQHRTPAALAQSVRRTNPARDDGERVFDLAGYERAHRMQLLKAANVPGDFVEMVRPCTSAQNGMLAQSLQSHGQLYVNHIKYALPKSASDAALTKAWSAVQCKYQALRMGFCQTGEGSCPFAMIIYSATAANNYRQAAQVSDGDAKLGADIIDNMARPCWRWAISTSSTSRTMTLSLHHALYDAESLQLLQHDFIAALQGDDIGSTNSIDPMLSSMLSGVASGTKEAKAFWQASLQNASFTPFPSLQPTVTPHHGMLSLHHDSILSLAEFEGLCRKKGCTIQAAGQSAWALLLAAYVGEPGVTFGTVFSGRTESSQDSTMFPSLSTLPIFCNTSKSTEEMLSDMVDFNAGAQRYRFAALSDIQRWADHSEQTLFDTMFVYQKGYNSKSLALSWPILDQSAAVDYSVSLELETSTSGSVRLTLTAQQHLVPETHAHLILKQYDHILNSVLRGEEAGVGAPSLYSTLAPKCPSIPSSAKLLHEFVEQGATEYPDKPALEFVRRLGDPQEGRQTWTYRQLNERANQTAQLLRKQGARPGGVVAVCMHKCPEASFAFVGILKAGCAFLALDPDLPAARRQFILEDSSASILFVDDAVANTIEVVQSHVVMLTEAVLKSYSNLPIEGCALDPRQSSYCLYTSGTTGTPKGCELTHENAVQAMLAFQRLFSGHWNAESRWLQFASYWFDVSVLEQFWSWSVGITVVGAPRDLVLDDLALFIRKAHITHIDLTPSLARILDPDDVPSLWNGVFITGGEALKQEIIQKWGAHKVICNGYGPTEATIGVTMNPFLGSEAKPSNIGPPFDNVGSYVFTPATTSPVLIGAVGELCVSGKLVGRGYLNRPDLTAKQFPMLDNGEKIYRTGDLVRQLADGSISFIGRQDTQAKLRGQRLEIDEIDAIVKTSSAEVADVASLVVKSAEGDKETLVTFLITAIKKQASAISIEDSSTARQAVGAALQACKERLPGYMVPTHIIPLNNIPLTVNNKVDAKRLTAYFHTLTVQEIQSLNSASQPQQPMDEAEKRVLGVLSDIMAIDMPQVNRSTSLFALGLSSVSAITYASLLKRAGFRNATVAMVLRNSSVGELTDALNKDAVDSSEQQSVRQAQIALKAYDQRYRGTAATRLSKRAEDIEVVAPCTPLQQGLILESISGNGRPYFNTFTYRLHQIDTSRLYEALQTTADNVQTLRTVFIETDDGHAQVVLRKYQVRLTENTCSADDANGVDEERRLQWATKNVSDLLAPFEMSIVRTPSAKFMAIRIHHALYDGISFDMLMDRLAEAYHGSADIDYGPRFIDSLAYGPLRADSSARGFWSKQLEGPDHHPMTRIASNGTDTSIVRRRTFDAALLDASRTRLGVSHQAAAQACFSTSLHQAYPQLGRYGLVVSGRSLAFDGADRVLGPLFNTIPSVLLLKNDDTWSQLAQRYHDFNLKTLPYQQTALRDIKKWNGLHPSDPVFDVLFVFQHAQAGSSSRGRKLWEPVHDQIRPEYPLACEIDLQHEKRMSVTLVGKPDYVTDAQLEQILHAFETALELVSKSPEERIANTVRVDMRPTRLTKSIFPGNISHLNGVHDFSWTAEAKAIRHELANLCGLNETEIDEHSSLFSIGLDSIDAVKLASRLKKNSLPLPVSHILRAQTIPRMLQALATIAKPLATETRNRKLRSLEQNLTEYLHQILAANGATVERVLPATPSQEALIGEMYRSGFQQYYNHDVLRLASGVDTDKLLGSWKELVNRSPILRTVFVEVDSPDLDSVYAQVILSPDSFEASTVQLDTVADMPESLRGIRDEVRGATDLRSPLRITLVSVQSEQYIILSLAHAQYDGHSLALMHEEVQSIYEGKPLEGRPANEPVIEAALTAVDEGSLRFWRNTLSGSQPCTFPRADCADAPDELQRKELKSDTSTSVARAFCQKHSVSLQSLAQTCWALTLAYYTRSLEVVFGTVLACRNSEEAERVMFPMMNTVPMRAALHGTRREMLSFVQAASTEILPYQQTPLRTIQSQCVDPAAAGHRLFDTLFVYQHRPAPADQQSIRLYESVDGESNIEYPVAVEMEVVGDDIMLRAACKDSVLSESETETLLERLDSVLSAIVNHADQPTVDFGGSTVSVCGLPPVRVESAGLPERSADSPQNAGDTEDEFLTPEALGVRDVLCQVSKTPTDFASATSSLESLGIDSISAIKVVALLRRQGIRISVSELLRARTIDGIASTVRESSGTATPTAQNGRQTVAQYVAQHKLLETVTYSNIDAGNVDLVSPATSGQMYMLGVWRNSSGRLFYPTFEYRLQQDVDREQLREAWGSLVQQHPILRTVFYATAEPEVPIVQAVLKHAPDSFTVVSESEAVDAPKQPMVQLQAIKQTPSWTLRLRIHHALYDAVSLPLLMEDLASVLAGSQPGKADLTFEDFIGTSLTPAAETSRKTFWIGYLRQARPLQLSHTEKKGSNARVEIFKPGLLTSVPALESLARREDLNLQSILFAAYAKIYATIASRSHTSNSTKQDVVLGIYLSNRAHLDNLSSLRAPTLNLVPLLVKSAGERSLLACAKQIQSDLQQIGTPENSSVALWQIKEWTGVCVDCFVNYLRLPDARDETQEGESAIRPVEDVRLEERADVVRSDEKIALKVPKELDGLQKMDAYQVSHAASSVSDIKKVTDILQLSLDIEVTVANGTLDMGLFCPESMLSLDNAENVFANLKAQLNDLTE